jgi:hypothetical protein
METQLAHKTKHRLLTDAKPSNTSYKSQGKATSRSSLAGRVPQLGEIHATFRRLCPLKDSLSLSLSLSGLTWGASLSLQVRRTARSRPHKRGQRPPKPHTCASAHHQPCTYTYKGVFVKPAACTRFDSTKRPGKNWRGTNNWRPPRAAARMRPAADQGVRPAPRARTGAAPTAPHEMAWPRKPGSTRSRAPTDGMHTTDDESRGAHLATTSVWAPLQPCRRMQGVAKGSRTQRMTAPQA